MNGVLILNKEKDMTSRDCINKLNKLFNTKKIGHTGTLDPLATGVLVCTIGIYTKLGEELTSYKKEYIAKMIIGYETDTLDITGKTLYEGNKDIDKNTIINTINSFKTTYLQEVPAYSSVKVNGKKMYEYARNNIEIELPKREVNISEIEIINIDNNEVTFRCVVSKGTYIRSLIRDIGRKSNTYATMSELIRTKQGNFNIEESYTLSDIEKGNYKLLEFNDILDLDIVECDDNLYKLVNNGVQLEKEYNNDFVLFKYNNENVCLYKKEDNKYKMYLKIN